MSNTVNLRNPGLRFWVAGLALFYASATLMTQALAAPDPLAYLSLLMATVAALLMLNRQRTRRAETAALILLVAALWIEIMSRDPYSASFRIPLIFGFSQFDGRVQSGQTALAFVALFEGLSVYGLLGAVIVALIGLRKSSSAQPIVPSASNSNLQVSHRFCVGCGKPVVTSFCASCGTAAKE